MTGKKNSHRRMAAALTASTASQRLTSVSSTLRSELQGAIAGIPNSLSEPINKALANKLSEHKGNVRLEDVKPGQMVLLNVSSIVNQPCLFQPQVDRLRSCVREATKLATQKDDMIALYTEFRREVMDFQPEMFHPKTPMSAQQWEQLCRFTATFEILAVLRQLCFDEPIPLIDISKTTDEQQDTGGDSSYMKARRIDKPVNTGNNQASVLNSWNQGTSSSNQQEKPWDTKDTNIIPCINMAEGRLTIIASFADDLKTPDALLVLLKDILPVEARIPEAFEACNRFTRKEGTKRSKEEWRQFITNCGDINALRHVLFGYPLCGEPLDANQMSTLMMAAYCFQSLESIKQTRDVSGGSSSGQQPQTGLLWQPGSMMSFDDLKDIDDVTVMMMDACGVPYATITNARILKDLEKRAQKLCKKDLAASKLFFTQLSKSCKKTPEELNQLRDKAKIGIRKSVEELRLWSQDCLYWCVLRKVLHNIPLEATKGRSGVAKGSGIKFPDQFYMH